MDKETTEILHEINDIFIDVLDDDSIVLTPETTSDDIEDWDSLTHIQLVVAIERHFKMKFTAQEIRSWSNVGEMVEAIINRSKLAI
ncbi:MAG: acyl carrier protein [Bacteroidales bacterium]|nr:acyl carrier protein [Bacteroidales bacterium]